MESDSQKQKKKADSEVAPNLQDSPPTPSASIETHLLIMKYLLSQGPALFLEGAPRTLTISPSRALTRASSLWAHKVRLRGPGPSSLEKQEALAGSSWCVGVLGAKYAETRAPWDFKRGYQLRIPSSVYPSLISSYPVSLPGPFGWCLPGSLEPVLSEPDWAGAPGDSSSPPHLTGWWPGPQGQPQTLRLLEPLQGKRRNGEKEKEGGRLRGQVPSVVTLRFKSEPKRLINWTQLTKCSQNFVLCTALGPGAQRLHP